MGKSIWNRMITEKGFLIAGIFLVLGFQTPVQAEDASVVAKQEISSSGAAEERPQVVHEVSDYREISSVLSADWEEDYFGSITVDTSSGQIIKDGEEGSFEEEFHTDSQKADQIVCSGAEIEEFLEESEPDIIYEVQENECGDVEITAPYQTKRLVIDGLIETDEYQASTVYLNTKDKETILQFATEEETKQAYEKAVMQYGETHCYVDEVFYAGNLLKSSGSASVPGPAPCYSWGTAYMGMNYLKSQTGYYGYGKKVTVAVIDSGADKTHSFFSGGRILSQSWNFADGNKNIADRFGHGTHVSGIIADSTPSNVKLLVLKVTNASGKGSLYSIKNALRYAVDKKVQVINMSMGIEGSYASKINYLNDVIRTAYYRGIPVCTAAGNRGVNVKYCYPANTKLPITVGAVNMDGRRASYKDPDTGKRIYYSNYGSTIDFAAPGTNIVSAGKGGNYYYMTGTSMAAPHVSASIAYIKMLQPNLSVRGVKKQLKSMSVDLGAKGKDKYFGWGCPVMNKLFQKGIRYQKDIVKPIVGKAEVSSLSNEKNGIKISWKKVNKADKYRVYRKQANGKYKKIAQVSAKERFYIDKKVKDGKKYTYIVRACRYGELGKKSQEKQLVCVRTVSKLKAKRKSKSRMMITWKKKNKISGYQIRYAAFRNLKKGKVLTSPKNKQQINGLRGSYCYYQVRAYKKVGKRTYYSAWSGLDRVRMR